MADRLEGNLLLIYGTIDENVRFNQAMLFMDALIESDKDFDTLIVPGGTHSLQNAEDYVRKQTMTYFLKNLGRPIPISGSDGSSSGRSWLRPPVGRIGSLCILLSFAIWLMN